MEHKSRIIIPLQSAESRYFKEDKRGGGRGTGRRCNAVEYIAKPPGGTVRVSNSAVTVSGSDALLLTALVKAT
ncbi:hypothetical protein PoB_006259600 [Plakobranchus ocellatus]|uniref:Uncharacterized protein n=1 Tax=Plakobranchus ocellatus TaxID=259542 RepID=A0AAV4CWL5_9GAST|nr:hypothetical protein PoB_006259600 [Plakobranchus ocellatus]